MKRKLYIFSFTLLGLLVATIVHAGFELPFLHFIISDYETHGDALWWRHWDIIHGMGGAALWILGAGVGFYLGHHYWHTIYVEKQRRNHV